MAIRGSIRDKIQETFEHDQYRGDMHGTGECELRDGAETFGLLLLVGDREGLKDPGLVVLMEEKFQARSMKFTSVCGATISRKQSKTCLASVLILELI